MMPGKAAAIKPPPMKERAPKPPMDAMVPSNAGKQAQSSDNENKYS